MDYGGIKRVKLLTNAPPPPPAAGGRSSFDPLTGDLEGAAVGFAGSLYSPPPSKRELLSVKVRSEEPLPR